MTFEELGIKMKSGTRFYTICPNCNDTRQKHKNVPCLTVNNEVGNRWYKCHHPGCGFQGNLDIQDSYKDVIPNSHQPKEFPKTYSKEVREYIQSRGFDSKTVMNEKIYEFTLGGKPIMGFPFYINLTLVNAKFFNLRWQPGDDGPRWWQINREYGTKSIFMGMQSISWGRGEELLEKKVIIISEGEWDWLTWKQCGYNNALSVPMGAPNPESKNFTAEFDYANDPFVQSFFKDIELIILATDNDRPGIFLRNQLATIFGKERCKYMNYPVGYKDINDVYNGNKKMNLPALGQEGVDECYNNLSSFAVAGIIKPSDVKDDLKTYAQQGFTPGLGIGVPEIDYLFTLKRKLIMFLTGVPGSGKSVFARWYAGEFVRHNEAEDIKWALFTPENRPVAREYARLAEVLTGYSFKEGSHNAMTAELRDKTMRFIEKHFFIISPDKKNFETWKDKDIKADKVNSMESVLQYLIYLKKTENIFGYIIDAWNKIEHEQPKYMTETTFISQQLDYLINFNDMYDVFGMVIVHPKKIDQQGANYKMPSLYDIKGSSAWKEKADYGVVAHRYKNKRKPPSEIPDDADEDDKYIVVKNAPTIIRTEKIRFEETGSEDRVKLMMDTSKGGRFYVHKEEKPTFSTVSKLNPTKEELEAREELPIITLFDADEEKDLPF